MHAYGYKAEFQKSILKAVFAQDFESELPECFHTCLQEFSEVLCELSGLHAWLGFEGSSSAESFVDDQTVAKVSTKLGSLLNGHSGDSG